MIETLPTPNQTSYSPPYVPPSMRLGSAAWFAFAPGVTPTCKAGDFFLGRLPSGHPLGLRDDRHVLVTAGTRGGKGTSLIVPNICHWRGSCVVIDPKGENALVTARQRGDGSRYAKGLGQRVAILDPFGEVRRDDDDFSDLRACFNPLGMIDADDDESIDVAARIADALVVSEGANDPFWGEAARSLIKAVLLHVATHDGFADEARTLETVRHLIIAGDKDLRDLMLLNGSKPKDTPSAFTLLFNAMRKSKAFHGEVGRLGEQLAHMEQGSPRMFISIAQVACTNLEFLSSPAMRRVTARSSFALSDLKTDPRSLSLYLCLPQRFMATHHRWLRMMATLVITEMERVRRQPACGHPVLFLLDEFAGLGRMKVIEHAAAQIAGFGVKLVFIVQTLAQLKDTYKDNWETLLANCGVKLFFCNDDHFTRDYVSKLVGRTEVVRTTYGESRTQGGSEGFSRSGSTTEGSTTSHSHGHNWNTSVNDRGDVTMSWGGSSGSSHGTSESRTYGASTTTTASWNDGRSSSQQIMQRYLLNPDEVGRLFGDRDRPAALCLISGQQPLYLKRIPYYRDESFDGRYDPHPDHPKPPTLAQRVIIATERERQARLKAEAEAKARYQQSIIDGREQNQRQIAYFAAQRAKWAEEERLSYEQWIKDRNFLILCLSPGFLIVAVIVGFVVRSVLFGSIGDF